MSTWTGQGANEGTGPRYGHYLLGPVEEHLFHVTYKKGEKPVEVGETEFNKLPGTQRKRELRFALDPKPIRGSEGFPYAPRVEIPSQFWKDVVFPSINDVMGGGQDAVRKFAQRAAEGNWYVEIEKVGTGRTMERDGRQIEFTVPKFLRMTQDLAEAKTWNNERFGDSNGSSFTVSVPDEAWENARNAFETVKKMSKGDLTKTRARFAEIVMSDDDLKPYAPDILEQAAGWQ